MHRSGYLVVVCAAALIALAPSARASEWDKKTVVNFGQPVEVPGAVLQPGKYVMKLLDSSSNRHIVEFMNERENHVYSLSFAIPAYRLQPTDKTTLTFYEAPAGQPEALKTWFYPGDSWGQEFTYPKSKRAELLASVTPAPPPALTSREETKTETTITEQAEAKPAEPPQEVTPAPEPVEIAQNTPPAPPPAAASAPEPAPAPETPAELPKTAGNGAAFALFGFASVLGAVGLRKLVLR